MGGQVVNAIKKMQESLQLLVNSLSDEFKVQATPASHAAQFSNVSSPLPNPHRGATHCPNTRIAHSPKRNNHQEHDSTCSRSALA